MLRRLYQPLLLGAVTLASLLLLAYVGFGEASRVYPKMRLERVAALGGVLKHSIETFTQTGLPLRQFAGFDGRAEALMAIDSDIVGVSVRDAAGQTLFAAFRDGAKPDEDTRAEALAPPRADHAVEASERSYVVTLPLRDKFGVIATARVQVDRAALHQRIADDFAPVFQTALVLSGLFAAGLLAARRASLRVQDRAGTWGFAAVFVVASIMLVTAMARLYADGVQAKTEGLAESMAQRLGAVTELGLSLDDLRGLDAAFAAYGTINPDVRSVALIVDGRVDIASDPRRVGATQAGDDDTFEFTIPLVGAVGKQVKVAVAVPVSVVYEALWRGGKNFIVLFIACGLVAVTFVTTAHALASRPAAAERGEPIPDGEAKLQLLKPAYFLAVFIDALAISFLPQYARQAAIASGWDASAASLPFTLYFLFLTLALVPTGRFCERGNMKTAMVTGVVLAAIGLLALAFDPGFTALCAGRALSGLGQGILLVAVQNYAMAVTPVERRTQAAAIQVHGYNAGLISGASIGGLLAAFTSEPTVFLIAALVGLATFAYLLALVDDVRLPARPRANASFLSDMMASLRDGEFLGTLTLIGVLSKFILAGVVFFAVPLVLSQQDFPQEDIGQIIMVYAITTLVFTTATAKLVDRLGSARMVLFLGSVFSGVGVLLFGVVTSGVSADAVSSAGALAALAHELKGWLGAVPAPYLATMAILAGMALIGVAQGMVAAPVITRIAGTRVASTRGLASVTSIYRLLERVGHISGPMVIGPLLVATGGNPIVIALVGALSIVGGGLFLVVAREGAARPA